MRGTGAVLSIAMVAVGLPMGCRAPTQVELEIVTDVACSELRFTEVTVGTLGPIESLPPATVTTQCSPSGRIGSLVVVPEGAKDDLVAIKVVSGFGPDTTDCRAPYAPGCIVARRALNFLPHEALKLEVQMRAACAGIPCEATETCRDGLCVDARVDASRCGDGVCREGALGAAAPGQVAGCGDRRGLAADSPWPVSDYCPTRIGRVPWVVERAVPREVWGYPTGTGTAVLSGSGLALFPTTTGAFVAVDAESGREVWRRVLGEAQPSSGALLRDGGLTFFAPPSLHVVDAETGVPRWSVELKQRPYYWGEPLVLGSGVLVLVVDDTVHAVDPTSRTKLWELNTGAVTEATIGPDGWVYVTHHHVDKVHPESGSVVASVDLAWALSGRRDIVVDGATALVHDGRLEAIDLAGEEAGWGFSPSCSMPSVTRLGVVVARGCEGTFGLDLRTGERIWQYLPGHDGGAGVVTGDDHALLFTGVPYGFALVDGHDGREIWHYEIGGVSDYRASVSPQGRIFAAVRDGGMRAYAP